MVKKIAFCFLIYDCINIEKVWFDFFEKIDKSKYNIYIHTKTQFPKLKYFNHCKIKENDRIKKTKWGDISLVKAQNVLLKEGLKDDDNKHFIFLSNSCIPFKSFNHIYSSLNKDYSYFNICPAEDSFPRCKKALNFIDKHYVQKAHQWCILNRKHANLMLESNEYMKWFDDYKVTPDEHCYITNLYVNKLENELILTNDASYEATTFTCWEESSLKVYKNISIEEQRKLINSPCFFGRKFSKDAFKYLDNEIYNQIINP